LQQYKQNWTASLDHNYSQTYRNQSKPNSEIMNYNVCSTYPKIKNIGRLDLHGSKTNWTDLKLAIFDELTFVKVFVSNLHLLESKWHIDAPHILILAWSNNGRRRKCLAMMTALHSVFPKNFLGPFLLNKNQWNRTQWWEYKGQWGEQYILIRVRSDSRWGRYGRRNRLPFFFSLTSLSRDTNDPPTLFIHLA
jgi:hypothetical protein